MIEDDLRRLDERTLDHPLDELEADVWRGVAARARQRDVARRVKSLQSVVMVLALVGSVAAGFTMAQPDRPTNAWGELPTDFELMPSSLLLGEHP